jgi:hypothetical protein
MGPSVRFATRLLVPVTAVALVACGGDEPVPVAQRFPTAAEAPYVLFEDFTHVKFYRRSFFDVVEGEEGASRASATSTTGCHSGWSPPPARTRSRT